MDIDVLAVLSRWMHIGTAIVLVGGSCCLRFVVMPVLTGQSSELQIAIRDRWKKVVHVGIAFFLLSGFYNYIRAMPLHKGDGLYHGLIGTKIILAFAVFFIASALVGRSEGTRRFRDQSRFWMTVLIALAAVIVAISGVIKVGVSNQRQVTQAPAGDGNPG